MNSGPYPGWKRSGAGRVPWGMSVTEERNTRAPSSCCGKSGPEEAADPQISFCSGNVSAPGQSKKPRGTRGPQSSPNSRPSRAANRRRRLAGRRSSEPSAHIRPHDSASDYQTHRDSDSYRFDFTLVTTWHPQLYPAASVGNLYDFSNLILTRV